MMSPSASVSLHVPTESGICTKCGSTSRVGRGLCLKCLLSAGIDGNGERPPVEATLDELICEIPSHDADWLLGNYQILEEIGRGGMGVIYRARQRHSESEQDKTMFQRPLPFTIRQKSRGRNRIF